MQSSTSFYLFNCFLTQFSRIFNGERVIAKAQAGRSLVTIVPAPTFVPSSTVTGATSTEFEPIFTLSFKMVFDFSFVSGL